MLARLSARGVRRSAALAAIALLSLTGCRSQQEVPIDANNPTDGPALIRLGPDDPRPAVGAAFDALAGQTFYLDRSVGESIGWFTKPSSKQWFPFKNQGTQEIVCTHEQAEASVHAFKQLLSTSSSAAEFESRFFELFEAWQSVGYNQDRDVLFTGYFSPTFKASRSPDARFRHALYMRPADLVSDPATGQPLGRRMADGSLTKWPGRAEIESSGMFAGTELVYLESKLDVYIVQVNGSAKLIMPDETVMYVGYAGKTDGQYVGLGKSLMEEGVLTKSQLSLAAIRRLYRTDPTTIDRLINRNDSYVFFQEYDRDAWPAGSLGTRVNEDASIATDKSIFPRGGVVMVDTRANTFSRGQVEYRKFMLDQDTGGAIRAAGRADLYMGAGAPAELLAGGQYATGKMFYFFLKPEHVPQFLPQPAVGKQPQAPKPIGR